MPPTHIDVAVIGGGAAGYFAALRAASLNPDLKIVIFESGRRTLEKVRISGGGRCNVTHHCFETKRLSENYPRGQRELYAAFHRFQAEDTVEWFASHEVQLKVEDDGRMFPVTDSSETIVTCLEKERHTLGISLFTQCKVESLKLTTQGMFQLKFISAQHGSQEMTATHVLLATGSHKSGHQFAQQLGHTITPLAPSLFTFNVPDKELCALSGVSVPKVHLTLFIAQEKCAEYSGPLLITHWGLSGPAVLKLSAWSARELFAANYQAILLVDWTAGITQEKCRQDLREMRNSHSRKTVLRTPLYQLPTRLWEMISKRSLGKETEQTWSQLSNASIEKLVVTLTRCTIDIDGKGQFKEEFVTCGGVELSEVDFRTMQSKKVPNLYFSGELLDIDGITGGFNFQSAWTTGWIAGTAIGKQKDP